MMNPVNGQKQLQSTRNASIIMERQKNQTGNTAAQQVSATENFKP
jgi:hypothetical protein